jgi:hypothetical protein
VERPAGGAFGGAAFCFSLPAVVRRMLISVILLLIHDRRISANAASRDFFCGAA